MHRNFFTAKFCKETREKLCVFSKISVNSVAKFNKVRAYLRGNVWKTQLLSTKMRFFSRNVFVFNRDMDAK